ncbi:MAG: hypothetical protein MUO39_12860, partial [Steroidobacteraceae bacterium]|nr:hypothetical protein [Steroidobacteraceae bacterium]
SDPFAAFASLRLGDMSCRIDAISFETQESMGNTNPMCPPQGPSFLHAMIQKPDEKANPVVVLQFPISRCRPVADARDIRHQLGVELAGSTRG